MKHRLTSVTRSLTLAAGLALAATTTALAGDYPDRPITLIVPYSPGGVTDTASRLLAEPAGRALGQQMIVENRPGASGAVGATFAARAEPDGYTLFYGSSGNLSINTITKPDLSYDPARDFIPIIGINESPLVLVVHPDRPYKTFQEFIAYLKENPGKVTFGSAGIGSNGHLGSELMQSETGTEIQHVPYKGNAQEVIDLVAGRIDGAMEYSTTIRDYVETGKLRVLATTGPTRMPSFPDAPTMTELGLNFTYSAWSGILAPAGTPQDIIDKLTVVLNDAIETDRFQEYIISNGSLFLNGKKGADFGAFIADQTVLYRKIIEDNNIMFQ